MSKIVPAYIVSCGSFNPLTNAHIMMLRTARAAIESHQFPDGMKRQVVHAFVSPVNDGYKKAGLAPFSLRRDICNAAFHEAATVGNESSSPTATSASEPLNWISLHEWEGHQDAFVPTYLVMKKIREDLTMEKKASGGGDNNNANSSGSQEKFEQYLVMGSDMYESMWKLGAWGLVNLELLIKEFNFVILGREGSSDPQEFLKNSGIISNPEKFPGVEIDVKNKYSDRFLFATMPPNKTSSTLVRTMMKEQGMDDVAKSNLVPPAALKILAEQTFWPVKQPADNDKA